MPDISLGNTRTATIIQDTSESVQDKPATTACLLPPTDDSGALLSTQEAYSDIL